MIVQFVGKADNWQEVLEYVLRLVRNEIPIKHLSYMAAENFNMHVQANDFPDGGIEAEAINWHNVPGLATALSRSTPATSIFLYHHIKVMDYPVEHTLIAAYQTDADATIPNHFVKASLDVLWTQGTNGSSVFGDYMAVLARPYCGIKQIDSLRGNNDKATFCCEASLFEVCQFVLATKSAVDSHKHEPFKPTITISTNNKIVKAVFDHPYPAI